MEPHEKLEGEIAKWTGVRNVVACSSGTAALHLALEALRLPAGSPVIVPDFCMVAIPRAVALAGLKPVFVDVDACGNLDPELTAVAVREANAKAIIVVHTYGISPDVDKFAEIADRHGIAIVEDLAEAHGFRPHRDTTAAVWSFYRNKIVAGEEGGAVAFELPRLADRARSLRCLGFSTSHDFRHAPRGHNYRLAPTLAGLISKSLEVFDGNVQRRWESWRRWQEFGTPDGAIVFVPLSPWVYVLGIPNGTEAILDELVKDLKRTWGVEARHGFKPCHLQEEWSGSRLVCERNGSEEPRSVRLSRSLFYLPLSSDDVERTTICSKVRKRIALAIEQANASVGNPVP